MPWNWVLFSTRIFQSSSRSLFPWSFVWDRLAVTISPGVGSMVVFQMLLDCYWWRSCARLRPASWEGLSLHHTFVAFQKPGLFSSADALWPGRVQQAAVWSRPPPAKGRVSTEHVKVYTKEPGKSQNILIGIFHLFFCSQLLLVC